MKTVTYNTAKTPREAALEAAMKVMCGRSNTAKALASKIDKLPAKRCAVLPLDAVPDAALKALVEAIGEAQCNVVAPELNPFLVALCEEYRRRNPKAKGAPKADDVPPPALA